MLCVRLGLLLDCMFGIGLIALYGIVVHPDLFGAGLRLLSLMLGVSSCVEFTICCFFHPAVFGNGLAFLCIVLS